MYQRAGKDGRDVQSLPVLEGVTASGTYIYGKDSP